MEHSHHGVMIAEAAEVIDSKYQEVEQIQVLARQWSWEFRYGNGTGNVTSTELHLPNNRRIKLVLHSEDVLHGLFIPAFRVKQDVILGVILILNLRRSVKGNIAYGIRNTAVLTSQRCKRMWWWNRLNRIRNG